MSAYRGLSIIVPTLGRDTLDAAIASLRLQLHPEDELIVVFDGHYSHLEAILEDLPFIPHGKLRLTCTARIGAGKDNDYGACARNVGLAIASNEWICYCDDDDQFTAGALDAIRKGVAGNPSPIHIFRMKQPSGRVLWEDQEVRDGNIGTPMIVHKPCGIEWTPGYGHDHTFLRDLEYQMGHMEYTTWHKDVICQVGHVPGPGEKRR